MADTRIAHNAWVIVADGGRALVLRNDGDATDVKLSVVRKYGQDNPATRDQGTDKPGRTQASVGNSRSGLEPTDFHQQAEDRMMHEVASSLAEDLRRQQFSELVVAAAPVALGTLRKAMSRELRNTVVAELPKDFTHFHLPELGDALDKALKAA